MTPANEPHRCWDFKINNTKSGVYCSSYIHALWCGRMLGFNINDVHPYPTTLKELLEVKR